jgi:hypothetical protein
VIRIVETAVRRRFLLTIFVLGCAACGSETATISEDPVPSSASVRGDATTTTSPERTLTGGLTIPPPLVVRNGSTSLEVKPTSFCWGNGCADGPKPTRPPDVGSSDSLIVEFPEKGWTFSATFQAADDKCGRQFGAELTSTGATAHRLSVAGRAGIYDVQLFGKGPSGSGRTGNGDVIAWVRWTTTTDGPLPQPRAKVGLLARHDGAVDSYGVELSISNLAATPSAASATITATSAEGRSISFEATPAQAPCIVGTVYFRGPNNKGKEAASLGNAPFAIEVRLDLDGVQYIARAKWPDDEDPEETPYVPLRFLPPLPALV